MVMFVCAVKYEGGNYDNWMTGKELNFIRLNTRISPWIHQITFYKYAGSCVYCSDFELYSLPSLKQSDILFVKKSFLHVHILLTVKILT